MFINQSLIPERGFVKKAYRGDSVKAGADVFGTVVKIFPTINNRERCYIVRGRSGCHLVTNSSITMVNGQTV